jgi:phosphoribosylanthranilate isomerase
MTRIKICGITTIEDARLALDLGAHALGFVFAAGPRRVTPPAVRRIIHQAASSATMAGVFVNEHPEIIQQIATYCRLDVVQLHGDESREFLEALPVPAIKAFRVKNNRLPDQIRKFGRDCFVLDSYDRHARGGTGKRFNWEIARQATALGKVILSGGLTPANITEALCVARPFAVDVSSGVEQQPGRKDPEKLERFIREVQRWDNQINSATSASTGAGLFLKH